MSENKKTNKTEDAGERVPCEGGTTVPPKPNILIRRNPNVVASGPTTVSPIGDGVDSNDIHILQRHPMEKLGKALPPPVAGAPVKVNQLGQKPVQSNPGGSKPPAPDKTADAKADPDKTAKAKAAGNNKG